RSRRETPHPSRALRAPPSPTRGEGKSERRGGHINPRTVARNCSTSLLRRLRATERSCGGSLGDAQINLLHLLVVLELGRFAFPHGAAGLQHIGVVGDFEREFERLLGEQ